MCVKSIAGQTRDIFFETYCILICIGFCTTFFCHQLLSLQLARVSIDATDNIECRTVQIYRRQSLSAVGEKVPCTVQSLCDGLKSHLRLKQVWGIAISNQPTWCTYSTDSRTSFSALPPRMSSWSSNRRRFLTWRYLRYSAYVKYRKLNTRLVVVVIVVHCTGSHTEASERADWELMMAGWMTKAAPVLDGHFFIGLHHISDVAFWKHLTHSKSYYCQ